MGDSATTTDDGATPRKGKGRALLGKAGRSFARVSQKVKNVTRLTTKSTPASPAPSEPPEQETPTRRPRVIRTKSTKLDQEWLDELSPEFFEPDFNDVEYVLTATESLELEDLHAFRDRRFQELHAVSRKFSRLVNDNAEQFVQELTRVSELQDQLESATVLCKKERQKLARADQGVAKGLEVIRKTQRKEVLLEILHAAEEIHGLSQAQTRLTHLLERDAFKEAIALARDCTEKLIMYSERGFAVVEDLASDLQDTYMQIEEHLDRALATCCRSFNREKYAEIIESYEMLGRPYAAHDRLGTYFVHAMQMSARDIARKHAGINKKSTGATGGDLNVMQDAVSTGARQYKNICSKRLKPENYESCLMEVCEAMCGLMVDFDSITTWHSMRNLDEDNDTGTADSEGAASAQAAADGSQKEAEIGEAAPVSADMPAGQDHEAENGAPKNSISSALTDDSDPLESLVEVKSSTKQDSLRQSSSNRLSPREYSNMKLEVHRRRLWLDVQRQIGMFLDEVNLSALTLPQYLQLLSHVKRLASIGEDFSEQPGDVLEKSIRQNSLTYVRAFHRDMMLNFKAKLAKESWDALHVVKGFNIYLLKEFSFLRKRKDAEKDDDEVAATLSSFAADRSMFQAGRSAIAENDSQQIAVDSADSTRTSSGSTKSNGSNALQAGEKSESATLPSRTASAPGKPPPELPHCSSTAMTCVRYFGRYLSIMDVLKPVAPEAFQCMTELFSLFLDTAWTFFGHLSEDRKLTKEEKRQNARLYTHELLTPAGRHAIESLKKNKQPRDGEENILFELSLEPLELSEHCELTNPSRLNGLEYVTTALESLRFLQKVLRSMRVNFGKRLPVACHPFLKNFYVVFVDTITELRWLAYKNAVVTMLHCDELTKACSSVKWDVKEIMSQHNPYVDKLVGELKIVTQRLEILGEQRVPELVQNEIWTEIIQQINLAYLDGFSAAKKCSVEGRAFMQLDYRQYLSKVGALCAVKPDSTIVDEWINAFYLPDVDALEEWLKSHDKKYSRSQLASLINVSSVKIGKKEKQRLVKVLDELKAVE
eukprot:m.25350 g.25350  ORF g.25350 m.25350 type:complete len:1054 (-) comp6186_c0_seq2:22-3183(-)